MKGEQMSQSPSLTIQQVELALQYLDSKQEYPPEELQQLSAKDWEELQQLLTFLLVEKQHSSLH
jgi:hypothetical protein